MTTTRAQQLALVLTLTLAGTCLAENRPAELLGIDTRAQKLLEEAQTQLDQGEYLEAINRLQQILRKSGEALVPTDEPGLHRSARWECHRLIASMPAEGRRLYRRRAEPAAQKWLETGRERLDQRQLRRIIDEAFCTRASEEALLLLGEIAFAEGDFESARRHWARLIPETHPLGLKYPDPMSDVAELRARIIVCLIFAGRTTEAIAEIEDFRQRHPDATGRLAGQDGNLLEILNSLKEPRFPRPREWSSFSGSVNRNAASHENPPYYWPERPTWSVPIPEGEKRIERFEPDPPTSDSRTLAFHPVMNRDHVWIADAGRVMRFHSLTGELQSVFDIRDTRRRWNVDVQLPSRERFRHTLSLRDGAVYARLGTTEIAPGTQNGESLMVRVNLDGHATSWEQPSPANELWEGAPMLIGERLFALNSRFDGGKQVTRIVSQIVSDEGPDTIAPELDWQRDVTEASYNPGGSANHVHGILSGDDRHVYHCTHAGWVVAYEAETGSPAWAYRYPLARRAMSPLREPGPCLVAHGRVFVAPLDADTLFCLDAHTGELIWEFPLIVGQLMGVVKGSLIGTTVGGVPGIFALDIRDGSRQWFRHDAGGGDLRPHGQGFVTDRAVLWPTNHGLYFLDPESGQPLRPPTSGPTGNLAFADGVLVITTGTHLYGYVSERRHLSERTGKILHDPSNQDAQYELGLALADAGQHELALSRFRAAGERGQRRAEELEAASQPAPRNEASPRSHLSAKQVEMAPPDLRGPLSVRWHHQSGARVLAFFGPDMDRCVLTDDERIYALSARTGQMSWSTRLSFIPREGWPVSEGVLVAGSDGIARLALDGEIVWTWQPRSGGRPGTFPVASDRDIAAHPRLSAFQIEGERLFAFQDERELLALDLVSGELRWRCEAYGPRELPRGDGPRFSEHYHVTSAHVLIQRSTGDVWQIDRETGQGGPVLDSHSTAANVPMWTSSPLAMADGSYILMTDAEHLRRTGASGWRVPLARPTGLTGEPAQLRAIGSMVLCRVRRNHGDELFALDTASGSQVWEESLFSPDPIDLNRAWSNESIIVYRSGDRILARRGIDATTIWEQTLPPSVGGQLCRIEHGGSVFVVVPDGAWPDGGIGQFTTQVRRHAREAIRAPTSAHLWRLIRTLTGTNLDWQYELVVLDPRGNSRSPIMERLTFPATGPTGSVRWAGHSVVVATGAGVWGLASVGD